MNAAFSATHYFYYVKRLYQKIYAQFLTKIILAQAYMKIKEHRKIRKKMVKSKIKVAVQKAGSTKPPSNSFFIEYEGGFGAPKIECAIVKLAFSLG